MKIVYFKAPSEFRRWLEANHAKVSELWVGFYKKDSGKTGITYHEALCFGWIDGIKKRVDELSYTHRFSPRKAKSNWSLINMRRAEALKKSGRMTAPGLKAFEARDRRKSGYSVQDRPQKFEGAHEKEFRTNPKAWEFFRAQPPGYQRMACWWVMSAKREETRWRRLGQLILLSEKQARLAVTSETANR
ncbi:MAG: bacteriocin-protection protein [Verrucomicrobia bacterium]|nr:bacteriocin-protection protein [Verrucomicrobiota bacterium]